MQKLHGPNKVTGTPEHDSEHQNLRMICSIKTQRQIGPLIQNENTEIPANESGGRATTY